MGRSGVHAWCPVRPVCACATAGVLVVAEMRAELTCAAPTSPPPPRAGASLALPPARALAWHHDRLAVASSLRVSVYAVSDATPRTLYVAPCKDVSRLIAYTDGWLALTKRSLLNVRPDASITEIYTGDALLLDAARVSDSLVAVASSSGSRLIDLRSPSSQHVHLAFNASLLACTDPSTLIAVAGEENQSVVRLVDFATNRTLAETPTRGLFRSLNTNSQYAVMCGTEDVLLVSVSDDLALKRIDCGPVYDANFLVGPAFAAVSVAEPTFSLMNEDGVMLFESSGIGRSLLPLRDDDIYQPIPRAPHDDAHSVADALHRHAYCVIPAPPPLLEAIRACESFAAPFFALNMEEKTTVSISNGRDVGYARTPVKEFYQARLSPGLSLPEPPVPGFISALMTLWRECDAFCRLLIDHLAAGLQVPPEKILELLDSEPGKQAFGTFTHTTLALYHYFGSRGDGAPCADHTDLGIITLIPVALVPGLEVYDPVARQWVSVEARAERTDVVVIGCQTIEKLTGAFYPASRHRVECADERISLVFKFRARSEAVLDRKRLASPILEKLFRYWPAPMRVDAWIRDELNFTESVNFPGASLDNYKRCVLDPSINGRSQHDQEKATATDFNGATLTT